MAKQCCALRNNLYDEMNGGGVSQTTPAETTLSLAASVDLISTIPNAAIYASPKGMPMSDDAEDRISLSWFPCFPSDALASCADMDAETFGHYWRILLFMYQRGGYAPADEKKLRHILNCSVQAARKVRDLLIADGRLSLDGERITKGRVQEVLKKSAKTQQKLAKNLLKTPQVIQQKPLNSNDQGPHILEPEPEPEITTLSKSARKRASRLPENWTLPDDWLECGFALGLPESFIRDEADRMANWSRGSPNGAKLDWRATWKNWIKREAPKHDAKSSNTDRHRAGFQAALRGVDSHGQPLSQPGNDEPTSPAFRAALGLSH
jgi:uncharacterized protein YdaU (DUF1376 family)